MLENRRMTPTVPGLRMTRNGGFSMPISMPKFHLFSFKDFQVDDCLKIKSKTYDAYLKEILFLQDLLESSSYFSIVMIPSCDHLP